MAARSPLVTVTPGKFAVVSVRNGREMTVRELDRFEDASALFDKALGNLSANMGPRDHMMILYTPSGGSPARQVLRSQRRKKGAVGADASTKPLHTFPAAENTEVRIFRVRDGFSVTVFDVDSGNTLPHIRVYPTEAAAIVRAELMLAAGGPISVRVGGDFRYYARRLASRTWEPVTQSVAESILSSRAHTPAIVNGRDYEALSTLAAGVEYEHSDPQDFAVCWDIVRGRVPRTRGRKGPRGLAKRFSVGGGKRKPRRSTLLERHESHPVFLGSTSAGSAQRQTWLDDLGHTVIRWQGLDAKGAVVERFPGEPRATAYDQTFWTLVEASTAVANAARAKVSGIGRELTRAELQNQRKAIAQDAERALKARDRADLAALRAKVKSAITGKRNARKAASALCAVVRERAKTTCVTSRASAKARGDEEISKSKRVLAKERAHQAEIRRLTRKAPKSRKAAARARASAKAESDSAVLANIDAALVPVWRKVKSRIKPTGRMSRTEAFEQWVHDHSAEVAEIQSAATERLDESALREQERAYFEHQSAAGDAPLPPLTTPERAQLIRRLYEAHKPVHRTKPGERFHPGVLMLDGGGASVLAPLGHMSDVQLRELAHRFRAPRAH